MVNQLFGNYLVRKGLISKEQLAQAIESQKKVRVKLGLIAVSEKLMTVEEAAEVNKLQAVMDKRFGDIAVEKGYLTDDQVGRLLGLQGNQYLTFAQAITDNGFLTLEAFEKAFLDYQKELGFTATDMESIKSGDADRIVPLFVPEGTDPIQVEYISVAVRTIIRLIDSDAYIGSASWGRNESFDGAAVQNLRGDRAAGLSFGGNGQSLLSIAVPFGKEEFPEVDLDALDSVAEFINCINGLFATGIASKVKLDMLPPSYRNGLVKVSADRLVKMPVYISGREVVLMCAFGSTITI